MSFILREAEKIICAVIFCHKQRNTYRPQASNRSASKSPVCIAYRSTFGTLPALNTSPT